MSKKEPRAPVYEELMAELARVESVSNPNARTTEEWADYWGVHRDTARANIKRAIKEGKMGTDRARREEVMRPGRFFTAYVYYYKANNGKRKSR